mmetsp:Transcript_14381/g.31095  ORF Transcript_14381/g.31095 Transcript_14381/m.31095 type:complete len:324 (+) Transcript_14381:118-1089(+)
MQPANSEETNVNEQIHGNVEEAGPAAASGSGRDQQNTDDEYETATSSEAEDSEEPEAGPSGQANDETEERGAGQHGCDHYRRRCLLVAPCCNEVFWCRHCHNATKSDNEQDPQKRHVLDRKAVREVVCALCHTRQPAGRTCSRCKVAFGRYACLWCNFFDDDLSKQQFHCDECGICRVGGRSNYFHCRTCNCCYQVQLQDSHVCIENSMHHNCPVCFEYLFDSIKPINVMPCGHTIHRDCLQLMADHQTYACPVCSKSYMSSGVMERLWNEMDNVVAQTPMPEEYRRLMVNIMCNDCQARSNVPFHVSGHKCTGCGSYNTRRV